MKLQRMEVLNILQNFNLFFKPTYTLFTYFVQPDEMHSINI